MLLRDRLIGVEDFANLTGWQVKPEGLCRAEVCIPLPPAALRSDGILDLAAVAESLHMPLLHEPGAELWALGPPAASQVRNSAEAPDLVLPDAEGKPFELRSLRGRKVLLLAWASW
jgi:hypothetical protein